VVDVAVSYQDGIKPGDICTQRLLSKIGRSVNKYGFAGVFDKDRGAETFIARIVGKARLAVACDRRHARGSSGSEEGQLH